MRLCVFFCSCPYGKVRILTEFVITIASSPSNPRSASHLLWYQENIKQHNFLLNIYTPAHVLLCVHERPSPQASFISPVLSVVLAEETPTSFKVKQRKRNKVRLLEILQHFSVIFFTKQNNAYNVQVMHCLATVA